MSTRTLQRRLTDERATFQQLISEARRELARHYLQHSSLELNETAYLLGYEEATRFFRAFQQWKGTSPGERWRAWLRTPADCGRRHKLARSTALRARGSGAKKGRVRGTAK